MPSRVLLGTFPEKLFGRTSWGELGTGQRVSRGFDGEAARRRSRLCLSAMKPSLLLGLLAGLLLVPLSVQAQAPALPSVEERAYVASRLYSALNTHFAHWEGAADVDLDAAYREYLAKALAAPDRRTFALESQAFLAQFRNGHTFFMDRMLLATPAGERVGFSLQLLEGQWVVATSEVPGLRPGDIVTEIDGRPFDAFYRETRPYLPASTEAWARSVLFHDIPGFYSGGLYFPLAFTLTLAEGSMVRVDREALPPRPAAPTTEGRWLEEGRVAYVRIPSFADPAFEAEAVTLVERFGDAETLIVDVRGNTGGSTPNALLQALMDRPYRWWAGSTPLTSALHQSYAEGGNGWYGDFRRPHLAWPARIQSAGDAPYQGRVFLLVDAACHSACEDFAMPFKDNGRGTLVGETTAGSTGQPYVMTFSTQMASGGPEMMALIGAKRERFPDGAVFEGMGIRPDVAVVLTRSDLQSGRDPILARALDQATATTDSQK